MNKTLSAIALLSLSSMPLLSGCKGNQALQQQADEIDKRGALHSSKIANLESQMRILKMDLDRATELVTQMNSALVGHGDMIQKINETLANNSKSKSQKNAHQEHGKTARKPSSKAKK
jgi:GTP cyclohydrolase III